jgi:hypothetical protein
MVADPHPDYGSKCDQNDTPISSLTLSFSAAPNTTGTIAKVNDAPAIMMRAPRSVVLVLAAIAFLGVAL